MFIVIEGIDGVGKSSLIQEMGVTLNCTRLVCPSPRLSRYKAWIDRHASIRLHYHFYRICMQDMSEHVRTLRSTTELILADRYWFSTWATHNALGIDCSINDFMQLEQPDMVLYLSTNEDVRRSRMQSRGLDPNDLRMLDRSKRTKELFETVLPGHTVFLDTTNRSLLEMTEIALASIKNFQINGKGI